MIEGTARARVQRALQTHTLPAGQGRGLKIGELVDFRRNTIFKDVTSWKGPAKVIDNTDIERGIVTIRYQRDLPIEVRLQDIRQHLEYLVFTAAHGSPTGGSRAEWGQIRVAVDSLAEGKVIHLGEYWGMLVGPMPQQTYNTQSCMSIWNV